MSSVCPDWEDLVCNRGTRCHMSHPEEIKQPEKRLNICRDFQNSRCRKGMQCYPRKHLTRQEESNYYKTGEMPNHEGDPKKIGGTNPDKPELEFCRDESRSGTCPRGRKCIYQHTFERMTNNMMDAGHQGIMGQMDRPRYQNDQLEPPTKRPLMEAGSGGLREELDKKDDKLDDFRKKITDLRDMNDVLYKQNEDLRNKLEEKDKRIALLESGEQAYTVSYTEDPDQNRRSARDADLYH